jgi:protein SCO1
MPRFLSALLLLAAFAAQAFDEKLALQESQAAIGRQVGAYAFRDTEGRTVRLSDLRGKPLVVNFVYTGCFQVCPATTQFLAGAVKDAERAIGPGMFRVATIGFNLPFDSPQAMKDFARKNGLASPNWLFLTPDAATLSALVADFGFRYEATPAGFDHLLQVSIVDQQGRIYRQVYGDSFDAPLFVGPLLQLAQNAPVPDNSIQAFLEQVKLLCTVYDPSAGRYRLNYVVIIELLVGTSVMLGGIGFLVIEWRRRRRPQVDEKTRATLRSRAQTQTERLDHLQDRGYLRIALRRQSLVKAFAPQPGFFRDPAHPLGARDVSQRRRDKRSVPILQRSFQIGGHVRIALQMLRCVPFPGSSLCHRNLLQPLRQCTRHPDVAILSPLVATGEKDHDGLAAAYKIDSISGPVVDPQFQHAVAHRLDVAGIAQR